MEAKGKGGDIPVCSVGAKFGIMCPNEQDIGIFFPFFDRHKGFRRLVLAV